MTDHFKIPKYKLVYFPVRGRAEFIRYLFALADVPYEEEYIDSKDWQKRKPGSCLKIIHSSTCTLLTGLKRQLYGTLIFMILSEMPFQSLPILYINDGEHVLNQSLAIARFLAKRFGKKSHFICIWFSNMQLAFFRNGRQKSL